MSEPASKKARIDSEFNADGLDALSELEKLDPLPNNGSESENAVASTSISSNSTVGASGGAPAVATSGNTPSSAAGTAPSASSAPFSATGQQNAQQASTGSGGQSVLQELLMNQPQGSNNSPRQPFSATQQQAQQNAFNTRSPLMHNGAATMMSPPTSMGARVPGPSPGAPQQQPQPIRGPGGQPMYPNDSGMMMGHNQFPGMQGPGGPGQPGMRNYSYPQQGASGGPAGMQYPTGAGRGAVGVTAAQQAAMAARAGPQGAPMMNGAPMGRGMPTQPQRGMPPMIGANPMMRSMMEPPFAQPPYGQHRPEFMQQSPYMRGPGPAQYPMMGQQMMVDANGSHISRPGVPGQNPMMGMNGHPGMHPIAMNQAARPGASTPGGQDPEKRKLIQQQLVLLLHAHKCQQRERTMRNMQEQNNGVVDPNGRVANCCNLPHCSTMKDVLQHMTTCNNGRACQFAHCASSRQIIAHWKNCARDDCPVCKPLKRIQDTPNASEMFSALDLMALAAGGPGSVGPGSVPFGDAPSGTPGDSLGGFGSPNALAGGRLAMAHSALFEGYNGDPFRLPNPPNKQVSGAGSGTTNPGSALAGGLPTGRPEYNLPPPDVPETNKEWHLQVTKDLRNHLVGKLVKAIFPAPDPNAMQDHRLRDLIIYARKVEKEMFESANDREEYYHLLAEKIYKIQKELQEKKNYRMNQATGGPQNFQPNDANNLPHVADLDELMRDAPTTSTTPTRIPGGGGIAGPTATSNSEAGGMQPTGNGQQPWMNAGVGPNSATPQGMQQPPMSNGPMAASQPQPNRMLPDMPVPINEVKQEPMDESSAPSAVPCVNGPSSSASTRAPTPNVNGQALRDLKDIKNSPTSSTMSEPVQSVSSVSSIVVKKEDPSTPRDTPVPPVKRDPTPPPGEDVVFNANELRTYLRPVWEKIDVSEDAVPFRVPVDPVLLNIPDYFSIVKEPMDLETICKNIDGGHYKNAWQFVDHMWLMFENAWLYNRKNSKVYKFSTKLNEMFVAEMEPVMREMGYCCAKKLSFTPLALFCYGASMCTIARDQPYFVYESNSTQFGVVVSERYTYCTKCFEALPPQGISLSENPNDTTNMAAKDKFKMMKNNVIDAEPFEVCKYCHRKWHRICALHEKKIFGQEFICDTCLKDKGYPKPENRFLAKKLPHNKLSTFLEDRVNNYIKKTTPAKAENCQVVIRTLCVQEKEVEVKPQMKAKYSASGQFPEKFPYRTKAVFAFEVIDGVEVCFFGLHVQEYGSECQAPNARRVYIAYLDSVHFFQPRELRTDVYHEILNGYLDYVRRLGYTMAHIWACPPSEGDDYIFHCHPPEQKIPKPKRLQDWYKKMLEKGVIEGTVVEFKDIYKQARDDNLTSPITLPYFEGDFWPNVIEDCIREANSEEAQRKKQEAAEVDDEEDDLMAAGDNGKKKSSKNKKNSLKKNAKMNKKKQGSVTGNEVADKLYAQFEKHKEVFFTIRLISKQDEEAVLKTPIVDPDGLMPSEMMDGRDTFLTRARDEHWEFSSLRRAKYSTLCLTHALHESDSQKGMEYTCNNCSNNNAKWHCNNCEDFDLCDKCHNVIKHEHPMEQIKSIMGDAGGDQQGNNRFESIQRCIQSLVHACQCRDANCRRMSCHKMKRVVQHTKMCKKRVNASCPVCKQLIALCCYHAKHCSRESCSVPFCMNIRQKLQEQKRSIARRSDMMMRRRMEGLHSGGAAASSAPSTSSTPAPSAPTPPASVASSGHTKGVPPHPSPLSQTSSALSTSSSTSLSQHMTNLGGGPPSSQIPALNSMGKPQMQQRFMSGSLGQPGAMGQQGQMYPGMQRPGMPKTGMNMPMMGPNAGQMNNPAMQPRPGGPMPGLNPPGYRNPNPNGPSQQMAYGMMGQGQIPAHMQGVSQAGPGARMQLPMQGGPVDPAIHSQLQLIKERLKQTKTNEERETVFNDLKKTPHLFSAFLRARSNEGGSGMGPQAMYMPGQPNQQMFHGPPSGGAQQPRAPSGQFTSMNTAWSQQPQQGVHARQAAQFGANQGRSPMMPMPGGPGQQQGVPPSQQPPPQSGQPPPDQAFR